MIAAVLFAGSMMAADATMTAGTNGSECTVNDVAGIKCGTSKAGGDMTITVGAGATKLSFYAAAWNNVSGLSLNLAADGVTISPASVSLTADAGISNNSPFTLVGSAEAFKFEVELTGVTAETTIAVTASTTKRFVVWGASYEAEGGDEPVEPAVLITFGDSAVDKGAWSNGAVIADKDSLVKLTLVDPDAKIAIDLNDANFGTTEEYVTLKSRLKTGGKSSSSKNYINVEVAKDGQLYIMARTGSNSATDRNVVITNGTDTIFNQLLLESNATEVSLDDATSMKIYPVYSASLNAGVTYRISYPVNGVNFYGFDFVPEEEPVLADPTNCAEAAEAALSVSANNELYNDGKEYSITGYVTSIQTAYNSQFNNISFWMADAADGGNVLEAYRAVCESAEAAPAVGDKVTVTGKLTKYNSTPEFAAGCTYVIVEKSQIVPQNLGAKTIGEFLALKNTIDTCVLTGVVTSIVNTTYGNLYLAEGTDTLYIYGVLTPEGASKQFESLNVAENDTLTVLAIYNEFNGNPQVKNAIFVEVQKAAVTSIGEGITAVDAKAVKIVRDGQLFIKKGDVLYNALGAIVRSSGSMIIMRGTLLSEVTLFFFPRLCRVNVE